MCIQDYQRICPSYLLIYRTTVEKNPSNKKYLKENKDEALQWKYINPKTNLMVERRSRYFKYVR